MYKKTTGGSMTLPEEISALVDNSKLSATEICERVGVSRQWLYDVISGKFKDPGIHKIERLREVLRDNLKRKIA